MANRINGVIHFGYALGVVPARVGILEAALVEAGVDFDIEIHGGEPDWPGLLDLFARALGPPAAETRAAEGVDLASLNP